MILSTRKQVWRFLGSAGYYRWFVPECHGSHPHYLVKGHQPQEDSLDGWLWQGFQNLKELTNPRATLFHPDFTEQLILKTDASEVGFGVVLSKEVEGKEHLLLFINRKLFPWEVNYSVIERVPGHEMGHRGTSLLSCRVVFPTHQTMFPKLHERIQCPNHEQPANC